MRFSYGLSLVLLGAALAPAPAPAREVAPGVTVSRSVAVALSRPLRELAAEAAAQPAVADGAEREVRNFDLSGKGDHSLVEPADAVDPVRQSAFPMQPEPNRLTDPLASFDGISATGFLPPDTTGDVGPNHYVQAVNVKVAVYDKTGTQLVAPTNINLLFAALPAGDVCRTTNSGDPIVLYDQFADRWLVSQFGLKFSAPTSFNQCIAISQTADPTGSWYVYDFLWATDRLNDYPHFGVWPDGYYATFNQFNAALTAWEGAGVAIYERDRMLDGLSAQQVTFDIGAVNLNYGGHQIVDLDGATLPSAGEPARVLEWDNAGWIGDPVDTLRLWEVHVDWTTPANSTFGANAAYDANFELLPADATVLQDTGQACSGTRACIPQPGTAVKVDSISDGRLMYRSSHRIFGDHDSLLVQQTVNAGGSIAGPRWIEIRGALAGTPAIYQQGTYSPDATHRWMGSVAMDGDGDVALGYSASSASVFPSILYTARHPYDPLGQMTLGEKTLPAGAGSQPRGSSRWGDYSTLSVDPTDDCTFWYTNQYYASTSSGSWKTRIGAFEVWGCGAVFAYDFENGNTSGWSQTVP